LPTSICTQLLEEGCNEPTLQLLEKGCTQLLEDGCNEPTLQLLEEGCTQLLEGGCNEPTIPLQERGAPLSVEEDKTENERRAKASRTPEPEIKKRKEDINNLRQKVRTIASWNVNSIRQAHIKKGFLLPTIKQMDTDVVLLQEVRGAEDRIYKSKGLMQGLRDLGYKYFHWNVCTDPRLGAGYSGVAVISKFPAEKTEVGLKGKDKEGRVLTVYFAGLVVTRVYTPCSQPSSENCDRGDVRKKFDSDLKEHIKLKRTEKDANGTTRTVVIMGDLNVTRTASDCWLTTKKQLNWPGSCFPYEGVAIESIIDECQMVDMAHELKGSSSEYTWFKTWYHKNKGIGMRIEYALVSREDAEQMDFEVLSNARGSDHQPIKLYLEGKPMINVGTRSTEEEMDRGKLFPRVEKGMFPQLVNLLSELRISNEGLAKELVDKIEEERRKNPRQEADGIVHDENEDHYMCSVVGKCVNHCGNECPYDKGPDENEGIEQGKETDSPPVTYVRMPVLEHTRMEGKKCKTLLDTGSTYDLVSREFLSKAMTPRQFANRLQIVSDSELPLMVTASGANTRPIGEMKCRMEVNPGVFHTVNFWVMDKMPIDFIIGCVHMDECG
jgi:exodeoxyribonuclease III